MPRRRWRRSTASADVRALSSWILIGAGLCAGAAAPAAVPPGEVSISMKKQAFEPTQLSVAAGTTVAWTNVDDIPHSVTADDQRFDSGAVAPGQTFRWKAEGAGPVSYHCIFHPSMTAVLNVGPPAGREPRE